MEQQSGDMSIPAAADVAQRRLNFLRRRGPDLGGVATASQVRTEAPLPEATIETEGLLELEDDLADYQMMWDEHNSVFTDYVTDPEHAETLGYIIGHKLETSSSRPSRRAVKRYQQQDFMQYAIAARLKGRLKAMYNFSNLLSLGFQPEGSDVLLAYKRANGIYGGLLAGKNFPPTPRLEEFTTDWRQLEKASEQTYKPILQQEARINKKAETYITSRPDGAERFLDSLVGHFDSEVAVEKAFVTHFANQHFMDGDNSAIAVALKTLRQQSGEGQLAERFLREKIVAGGLLSYIATIWPATKTTNMAKAMLQTREAWPADLATEYEQFAQATNGRYQLLISKIMTRSVRKDRLQPDVADYAQIVNRLFNRMHGQPLSKHQVSPSIAPPGQTDNSIAQTANSYIPEKSTLIRALRVGIIRQNGDGLKTHHIEGDTVLDSLVGQEEDSVFRSEITKVIERLQTDPFGRGVRSVAMIKGLLVDGKRQRVYRASPAKMYGMSFSRRTKDCRLIFTVNANTLSIHSLQPNHEAFERAIARLA